MVTLAKPITIVVNASAARESGALTILSQFVAHLSTRNDLKLFIVFISEKVSFPMIDNVQFVQVNTETWGKRISWDFSGLKTWLRDRRIVPDLVISFQNMGVNIATSIPQLVYYHQPMSLGVHKWNPFKSEERLYFLYEKIYPIFVRAYLKRVNKVIVQRESMKAAFAQKFNFDPKNVIVLRPDIPDFSFEGVEPVVFHDDKVHMMYVATPLIYKNHMVLVEALDLLKSQGVDNLIIHLTCEFDNKLPFVRDIISKGLTDHFVFEGKMTFNQMLRYYLGIKALLFPSYIETFGLPLIEAASAGIPVICSNLPYTHEVLSGYKGAVYVSYNDSRSWALAIKQILVSNEHYKPFAQASESDWHQLFIIVDELTSRDY